MPIQRKIDYVTLSAKEDAFINEFFSITDNDVRIKSAVVSRELLSYNLCSIDK